MQRRAELLLWISGSVLLALAAVQLLAYNVFQSDPALFTLLGRPSSPARSRTPLCRLQIPRLQINVAVLEGDDDATLDLAPGHIPDSAAIGARGNAVLAGHRDIAFRKLRFIQVGDQILLTGSHAYQYVVTGIHVISPDDLSVLSQTPRPTLTLITCYPFYFVGNAPKRFVVQAAKIPQT